MSLVEVVSRTRVPSKESLPEEAGRGMIERILKDPVEAVSNLTMEFKGLRMYGILCIPNSKLSPLSHCDREEDIPQVHDQSPNSAEGCLGRYTDDHRRAIPTQ